MAVASTSQGNTLPDLTKEDMPELYKQSDPAAARAQTRYFRLLGSELILVALGTAVGLFSAVEPLAIPISPVTVLGNTLHAVPVTQLAAGLLILGALIIRLIRFFDHSDTKWYQARAVAESVKSVAWRYAVGGRPFEWGKDPSIVDALAIQRISDTLTDMDEKSRHIAFTRDGQITGWMRSLRQQPLILRREAYLSGRIIDQRRWYEDKQQANRDNAVRANVLLIILESASVIFAALQALKIVELNFQTLIAAVISGGIAWSQAQRFQDLSASYRLTAKEAASLEHAAQAQNQMTEAEWAAFVDSAEEAFSREHSLWRATRDE